MNTDVLIVGGGLAGLSLARQLQQANIDYHLAEARPRFGGRIGTQSVTWQGETGYFDTGPAWFWSGQPRIHQLIQALGLTPFLQYAAGEVSFEDEKGQVSRGRGYASMAGSYRLRSGLAALVQGLQQPLKPECLSLNLRVSRLQQVAASPPDTLPPNTLPPAPSQNIAATCLDANHVATTLYCNRVVLALPPRVAAERIEFMPALPPPAIQAMENIATWMAGHAKIIAVYETPFWREVGLSGDAMSRRGPLAEIHDASPDNGGPYGLFGFVSVPAVQRQHNITALREVARQQLARLFGPDALNPIELIVQDWAFEPETATPLDLQPLYAHPVYGLPQSLSHLWDGQLMLGSTEVAANFGGYLEGALEASEITFNKILNN